MAKLPIEFKIKTLAVEKALRNLVFESDKAEALGAIGADIQRRVKLGFRSSTDPWGVPWKPIKHRKGQPLVDTGRLRNSITYRSTADSVIVGTNVEYAAIQHFGGTIKRKPSQRTLYRQIKKSGEFKKGGRFVKASRSNYATTANVGEYSINIAPRPFLPVDKAGQANLPPEWAESALNKLARALKLR